MAVPDTAGANRGQPEQDVALLRGEAAGDHGIARSPLQVEDHVDRHVALFGLPEEIAQQARAYLTDDLEAVVARFHETYGGSAQT